MGRAGGARSERFFCPLQPFTRGPGILVSSKAAADFSGQLKTHCCLSFLPPFPLHPLFFLLLFWPRGRSIKMRLRRRFLRA